MRSQIKILLILLYFSKDIDVYIERLSYFGVSISTLIYLIFFALLLISVVLVAHIKNNFLRILLGVVFLVSTITYDSYQRIMLEIFNYNAYINMVDADGAAGDAFDQFGHSYMISAAFALLLLIGICIKPTKWIVNKWYLKSVPFIAFFSLTALVFAKGGSGTLGLPSVYTTLSYSSLMLYELSQDEFGIREDIRIPRENESLPHDIVYILDESVVANYLDINNANGVHTALNEAYPNINIYNYGYAASVANCSMATNITLRFGGTRTDYKKYIYSKPSIWAYAKQIGLKTIYIDAQRTDGELQNGMTINELENIDAFIQFNDIDPMYRDQEIAKTLVELINKDTQEFIFVTKMGLHFPIHDKYPDEYLKFEPALKRGTWKGISDTGNRDGFNGTVEEWIRYRNSYRNAIEWNVGAFFSKLLSSTDLNKALLIYSSDHRLDLHERKNPGNNTHCSAMPTMEEGLVPFVIIQGDQLNTMNWDENLSQNKDRSSHYNIFPTLLKLMKYDNDEVTRVYGNSLDAPTKDDLTFNKYWNERLGRQPSWKKIDLNNMVNPPKSDYQQ